MVYLVWQKMTMDTRPTFNAIEISVNVENNITLEFLVISICTINNTI